MPDADLVQSRPCRLARAQSLAAVPARASRRVPVRLALARLGLLLLASLAIVAGDAGPLHAADPRLKGTVAPASVRPEKQTMLGLYLTAREAAAALASFPDLILIDVRSRAAVLANGLAAPTRRNIPFLAPTPPDLVSRFDAAQRRISPRFLPEIERLAGTGPDGNRRTIIVICPDGSHSALAVDHLADAGFSNVYLIVDGFRGSSGSGTEAGGWLAAGLPWLAAPRPDQLSAE